MAVKVARAMWCSDTKSLTNYGPLKYWVETKGKSEPSKLKPEFEFELDVVDISGITKKTYKLMAKKERGWWCVNAKFFNNFFEKHSEQWNDARSSVVGYLNKGLAECDSTVLIECDKDKGTESYVVVAKVGSQSVDVIVEGEKHSDVVDEDVLLTISKFADQASKKAYEEVKAKAAIKPKLKFEKDGDFDLVEHEHALLADVNYSIAEVNYHAGNLKKRIGTTTANKIARDTIFNLISAKETTAKETTVNIHILELEEQDVRSCNLTSYLWNIQKQIEEKSVNGVQMVIVGITHRGYFHSSMENHAILAVFTRKGVEIIDSKAGNKYSSDFIHHISAFQDENDHLNCARYSAYTAIEMAKLIKEESNDIDVGELLNKISKPSLDLLSSIFWKS
ncbi:hypothetical protein D5R81_12885 [Parashewanella spongiae]|uniref:Uncharacterized protein n=1 Tax=Parashewanella spongiae TaxID=342950 RepID=A0A3A6TIE9_9GAMM|nr:hypothetical protein [Parashewanella spongiae]MCL1078856.1 hypothetical protein [Parashewanella spongiae]RJY11832.1 hypothetical protein D5R81_12885 [Parashewanella spongiae]